MDSVTLQRQLYTQTPFTLKESKQFKNKKSLKLYESRMLDNFQLRSETSTVDEIDALKNAIDNVASATILTESQLMHLIAQNPQLEYYEINESVLMDLARNALMFSEFDEPQDYNNSQANLPTDEPVEPIEPNYDNDENTPDGDVNTIIFGADDRIELPVGYTHVAIDGEGNVHAYTGQPFLNNQTWDSPDESEALRIGRVQWDENKLNVLNDDNLKDIEMSKILRSTLMQVHNDINLGSYWDKLGAFTAWGSDNAVKLNESTNHFMKVPTHLL